MIIYTAAALCGWDMGPVRQQEWQNVNIDWVARSQSQVEAKTELHNFK